VNLLGPGGAATVAWGEDFVGADPAPAGYVYPEEIYNDSDWTSSVISQSPDTSAATRSTGTPRTVESPVSCDESWQWVQILWRSAGTRGCHPGLDEQRGLRLHGGHRRRLHRSGTDDDPLVKAYVVVDLGSSQSFNTLRIFQMFSRRQGHQGGP
jgi:hypothetical protein